MKHKIESLNTYRIPRRYGWDAKVGVRLEDFGFYNICDCLHKRYGNQIEPFPLDFDMSCFSFGKVVSVLSTFIEIEPKNMIMAQRYLDRDYLLDLIDDPNPQHTRMIKCGKYYVLQDGHHRLALKHMRRNKILTKLTILK